MRQNKYLGRSDWMLPLASRTDCEINGNVGKTGGYGCDVSGMGHLYYGVFKHSPGAAAGPAPESTTSSLFSNVQPSLHWACTPATPTAANTQAANLCDPTTTVEVPLRQLSENGGYSS